MGKDGHGLAGSAVGFPQASPLDSSAVQVGLEIPRQLKLVPVTLCSLSLFDPSRDDELIPFFGVSCFMSFSPEGGIHVTENGTAVNEPTVDSAVDDKERISYFEGYLKEAHNAIQQGADVRAVS